MVVFVTILVLAIVFPLEYRRISAVWGGKDLEYLLFPLLAKILEPATIVLHSLTKAVFKPRILSGGRYNFTVPT